MLMRGQNFCLVFSFVRSTSDKVEEDESFEKSCCCWNEMNINLMQTIKDHKQVFNMEAEVRGQVVVQWSSLIQRRREEPSWK